MLQLWLVLALVVPLGQAAGCSRNRQRDARAVTAPLVLTRAACQRDGAVDVLRHRVELELSAAPAALSGRGEIVVRPRRATRLVMLDATGLVMTAVSQGQAALRFAQQDDVLCVELQKPLAPGRELALKLAWKVDLSARALHFAADQVWAGYRASAWMPTRQDPAQRATLELAISAPQAWKVVASGLPTGAEPAGSGRTRHGFELSQPSPPLLFAFAAGVFAQERWRGPDYALQVLGPPGSDLGSIIELTRPMYALLRERTGMLPPQNLYTQVFVHADAAQEAAGFGLLAEQALDDVRADPKQDWIFSHELAHQWFGWLVPCADFADFWLNEGFATFMVAVAKEQRWGRREYDKEVEGWRARSRAAHAAGRDAPVALSRPGVPHRAPRESELQARAVTYYRGALVLHKLRSELGDDMFWDGVRRYVRERAGKAARTEDLRAALEIVSGRDLAGFFERWLYQPAADL